VTPAAAKEIVKEAEAKMKKSLASVQDSLATLRVGRASPTLLDRVQVEYYGAPTPLNQLASVTAPTASQLVVDVFDKSCIGDVEKALFESDLGMTPNNDGKVIRLNVPQLTTERRKELTKTAKSLGEDGKVALRNIRKGAIDKLKKMKKGLGEDVTKDFEDEVQKAIKKYEGEVGDSVSQRESEIMTV
jgi:ribosome recycling factor